MDKVLCPGCGLEMGVSVSRRKTDRGFNAYVVCGCGWCGPMFNWPSRDGAIERAKAAALVRYKPLQKPLTLEAVKALKCPIPVWIEHKSSPNVVLDLYPEIALDVGIEEENAIALSYYPIPLSTYQHNYRLWKDKPTDAERAAAPWEED